MGDNKFEETELKDIFMLVWRRKILLLIVAIVTILIGIFATIIVPEKLYQSETDIEISGVDSSLDIGTSNDQSIQNMLNIMIKPLDMNFEQYVGYIEEDEVLGNTISELNLEDRYSIESLGAKLNITPDEENESINIKFSSSNPEEPVEILNSLSNNYMDYITEEVKTNSEEILIAIEEQTKVEKEKYERIFDTYENFINENKSIEEYEIERKAMSEQIVGFRTSLKNLQIKETGIRAAIKENNSSSETSGGSILKTNDGNVYIGDAKKELDINLSEAIAMKSATEETIISLEEEIKQTNIDYQRAEIEAISINQKLKTAKESYESFARTYETLQTISTFDKGKLGIVISEKPKESIKIQTNSKLKLLMIIVLGIMFGIISTFIKEYLESKKLKNNKDAI